MSENLIHINPQTKAVDMIDIRMYEELKQENEKLKEQCQIQSDAYRKLEIQFRKYREDNKLKNDKFKEALRKESNLFKNALKEVLQTAAPIEFIGGERHKSRIVDICRKALGA